MCPPPPPPPPPLPTPEQLNQASALAQGKSSNFTRTSNGDSSSAKPKVVVNTTKQANGTVVDELKTTLEKRRKKAENSNEQPCSDEKQKKPPIPPKPATLKQENAQSGNNNSYKQPKKMDNFTQTINTAVISDTNTKSSINKTTILKYSIAIFSLCASSFTAGLYFLHVTLTIPTVVFAISIIIALIAAIYLIKSIVSELNDKKKVDLSKKEFDQPVQQNSELQEKTENFQYKEQNNQTAESVDEVDGRALTQPVPTPTPLPPTTGTASPQVTQNTSSSTLPPPPPPPMQQGAGAPPPPPPPPPGMNLNNGDGGRTSLLDSIRKAGGKPKKNGQNSSDSTDSFPNKDKPSDYLEELGDKLKANGSEQREGINERIERERKEKIEKMIEDSKNSNSLTAILVRRNIATHGSDDSDRESEYSDHDNERADDEEWDAVFAYQERVNPTEAGAVSAFGPSNGTNPHEKPSVPPKPKDLTSKLKPALTQAPPETTVNDTDPVSSETQNPYTFSVKDCAKQWERHG